ncbi:MAG TPA: hypothetical protein PK849_05975 [Synergistales bacterium]|nr:hypothetical protein [Synergistales bacterium]
MPCSGSCVFCRCVVYTSTEDCSTGCCGRPDSDTWVVAAADFEPEETTNDTVDLTD